MARTVALALVATLSFLGVCEAVFRLLPVSTASLTGYPIDPMIMAYPPSHRWWIATGWDLRNPHRLQANNMGLVADRDFTADPNAVALIGDSFVEASMLDDADRPGAQLQRLLGAARPVYAMGGPGSNLLDYAERIRWSVRSFGTQDIVLMIERGDVRQSLCGSANVHAACLDPKTLAPRIAKQPEAGAVKRLVRHSAFAQYLVSQLKLSPSSLWWHALEQSRPVGQAASSADRAVRAPDLHLVDSVTDRFFARISDVPFRRLVMVVDSDRRAMEEGRPFDDAERQHFIRRAREGGATVVDTLPIYAAHSARSVLKLEVGPDDAHLNPLAVGLAMAAAMRALELPPP